MPRVAGRFGHLVPPKRLALTEKFVYGNPLARARRAKQRRIPRVPQARIPPAPDARNGAVTLTWLGQATFLVQARGMTILTDPVWAAKLPGGFRRLSPPPVALDALPHLDAILLSHNHYDHMDAAALARLRNAHPDLAVFVPTGLGTWFRKRGFKDVREHGWGGTERLGPLQITCVEAKHWSRRGLFDENDTLWCGWHLAPATGKGKGLLFAGDTGDGDHVDRIAGLHRTDIALLPVGGYAPKHLLGCVHMDPDEAVDATARLGARHLVPMHWGTYILSAEPVMEPIDATRNAWLAAGRRRADLIDLPLGGSVQL